MMALPGALPKRSLDVICNAVVGVAIVAGATILGMHHVLAPEGVLGAFGIAAAVNGLPIVVKREVPPS